MPPPKPTSLTQEDLKRFLDYDPKTGVFRWKPRQKGGPGWCQGWNGKWAGREAGTNQGNGYLFFRILDQPLLAHRVAWAYVHGFWPPDQIDHINMVRNDNRISNLRLATNAQNTVNRLVQDNNATGLRGVRLHASGLWQARIHFGGHEHSLGYWKTPEDASRCYGVVARLLHSEFSRSVVDD